MFQAPGLTPESTLGQPITRRITQPNGPPSHVNPCVADYAESRLVLLPKPHSWSGIAERLWGESDGARTSFIAVFAPLSKGTSNISSYLVALASSAPSLCQLFFNSWQATIPLSLFTFAWGCKGSYCWRSSSG